MYTMSTWALAEMTLPRFYNATTGQFSAPADPVPWAGVVLIALAAVMLVEAIRAIASSSSAPPERTETRDRLRAAVTSSSRRSPALASALHESPRTAAR